MPRVFGLPQPIEELLEGDFFIHELLQRANKLVPFLLGDHAHFPSLLASVLFLVLIPLNPLHRESIYSGCVYVY